MAKAAFALRAGVEDFSGGTVSLPGGEAFNVGEALDSGGGKIVLDPDPQSDSEKERERAARDSQIIEALSGYPALKNTTTGDSEPITDDEVKAATSQKKGGRS